MKNPEKSPNISKFVPGTPVRIKNTAEHTINHEYMPNGITGLVEKVGNGMVFVAYRIPGDGIQSGQKNSVKIIPFKESEIEEIIS